mmetsp:Transcript_2459/g.9590  ORF Transcript_2459/g.9590 Transcript_2459/m.9590 type:complete len:396 (-) Transcript_2459:905-2092(-)
MASPYGPALGTPGFGAAAAAHGTPMTGGRFQTDDAFGRDSRFGGGFGSGSNPGAFAGDAFPGSRAAVRDRDLRTSAAPDYAPLLFGASPGPAGAPSPALRGFDHAAGSFGNASLHTPGPAARRTPGFFGAGGRDAPGTVHPGTGGKRIFGGGFAPASGGTGAGASDSGHTRSPRSPRLSGKSPSGRADGTPSGHVGTPWANRARRGDETSGAEDFYDAAGADLRDSFGVVRDDERWVVVYGFDPDRELSSVLLEFQKDGDIETHVAPLDDPDANFCYVRFADAASARRALRRNGRRAGGRMVGVAPLDARSRAKLRETYGDEGFGGDATETRRDATKVNNSSGLKKQNARVVRARAGSASAPSSRPHSWRPTRDGVALQPRRAFWDKVTEFVFGC